MEDNQELLNYIAAELKAAKNNCSSDINHKKIAMFLEELFLRRTGNVSGLMNGAL